MILRPIPGFEGRYAATADGRIWSHPNKLHDGIFLKPTKSAGYYSVNLSVDGTVRSKKIHRLVAQAFIKNAQGLKLINHINGNKLDNRVGNLEWCTASENLQKAWSAGQRVVTEKLIAAGRRVGLLEKQRKSK